MTEVHITWEKSVEENFQKVLEDIPALVSEQRSQFHTFSHQGTFATSTLFSIRVYEFVF